jgi:hypothetical protein
MVMDELEFPFQIILKHSSQELMIAMVQAIRCIGFPRDARDFHKSLLTLTVYPALPTDCLRRCR